MARLSPLVHSHLGVHGTYTFAPVQTGAVGYESNTTPLY
jgi:hypothetical protein